MYFIPHLVLKIYHHLHLDISLFPSVEFRLSVTKEKLTSFKSNFSANARLAEYNVTSYPTDFVEVDGGATERVTVSLIAVQWSEKHPLFDKNTYQHDIGLVKLATPAENSGMKLLLLITKIN